MVKALPTPKVKLLFTVVSKFKITPAGLSIVRLFKTEVVVGISTPEVIAVAPL